MCWRAPTARNRGSRPGVTRRMLWGRIGSRSPRALLLCSSSVPDRPRGAEAPEAAPCATARGCKPYLLGSSRTRLAAIAHHMALLCRTPQGPNFWWPSGNSRTPPAQKGPPPAGTPCPIRFVVGSNRFSSVLFASMPFYSILCDSMRF